MTSTAEPFSQEVPAPAGDPERRPGTTPAQHLEVMLAEHKKRQTQVPEHQARMRRAGAAVLGTSKGLEPAPGPAVAGIITIDAHATPWPIVIDGLPLPWYVDQDIRVDASSSDGQGRLWVGILAETINVERMPIANRAHQTERERLAADLNTAGMTVAALRLDLDRESTNHDQTIRRLTRTRRALARVHQAATRYVTERDEARYAAQRAEVALANLAGDQATLALAVVEAGGPGQPQIGGVDLQAVITIRRLTNALALAEVQTEGLKAERDALAAQRDDARADAADAAQGAAESVDRIERLDDATITEVERLTRHVAELRAMNDTEAVVRLNAQADLREARERIAELEALGEDDLRERIARPRHTDDDPAAGILCEACRIELSADDRITPKELAAAVNALELTRDQLDTARAQLAELEGTDAEVWMGRCLAAEAKLEAARAPLVVALPTAPSPILAAGLAMTRYAADELAELEDKAAAYDALEAEVHQLPSVLPDLDPPTVAEALAEVRAAAQAEVDDLARRRDQEGLDDAPRAELPRYPIRDNPQA